MYEAGIGAVACVDEFKMTSDERITQSLNRNYLIDLL